MSTDHDHIGRTSLRLAILGLVLPIIPAMVFAVLLERNILREPGTYYGLCLLMCAGMEFAAFVCGLKSRRTGAGWVGLFIAVVSLLLLALILVFTTVSTRVERVQEQVGPAARP